MIRLLLDPTASPWLAAFNVAAATAVVVMHRSLRRYRRRTFNAHRLEWEDQ